MSYSSGKLREPLGLVLLSYWETPAFVVAYSANKCNGWANSMLKPHICVYIYIKLLYVYLNNELCDNVVHLIVLRLLVMMFAHSWEKNSCVIYILFPWLGMVLKFECTLSGAIQQQQMDRETGQARKYKLYTIC